MVTGASCEEDIVRAADAVIRADYVSAVLFDDVPGWP